MADEKEPVDPTTYLDKAATPLQARFGDWIKEEVGYNPTAAKTKEEAFREGVRIATATRMVFQASDYNRSANEESRAQRAKERAERERQAAAEEEATPKPVKAAKAPAPAKAAKATPAKKAAKPVVVETEAEDETTEAPAPRRAPARRAPARRATATAEAPF